MKNDTYQSQLVGLLKTYKHLTSSIGYLSKHEHHGLAQRTRDARHLIGMLIKHHKEHKNEMVSTQSSK